MTDLYSHRLTMIDGRETSLAEWQGKVLLIVNTASECGFTPQFAGLEELYKRFSPRGLVVLGFPCNQFGGQEPGDAAQIGAFCQRNYGVTFPMHAKIEVNGHGAHPLFKHLKREAKGVLGTEAIKWNFTKFLVDRDGRVVRRYGPRDTPEAIAKDLEAMLASNAA
jgi:glutathione peroxidase